MSAEFSTDKEQSMGDGANEYASLLDQVEPTQEQSTITPERQRYVDADIKHATETARDFLADPTGRQFEGRYANADKPDELKWKPKMDLYSANDSGVDGKEYVETVRTAIYEQLGVTDTREEVIPTVSEPLPGEYGYEESTYYTPIDAKSGIVERVTKPVNGNEGATTTTISVEKRLDDWR